MDRYFTYSFPETVTQDMDKLGNPFDSFGLLYRFNTETYELNLIGTTGTVWD